MSYSTSLTLDNVESNYAVVMSPRRRVMHTDFTAASSSVYESYFPYGPVTALSVSSNSGYLSSTTTALSAGQFNYDLNTNKLYLRKLDSSAPAGNDFVACQFEIYLATKEIILPRVVTSAITDASNFQGLISKAPDIRKSTQDTVFGFNPIETTSITCINDESYWQNFIYDSSFYRVPISVYHILGDMTVTTNAAQVMVGSMFNLSIDDTNITFQIQDKINSLDQQVHNPNTDYYQSGHFTKLDPTYNFGTVRTVYGSVKGFVPVNLAYKTDAPAFTDNRDWACVTGNITKLSALFTSKTSNTIFGVASSIAYKLSVGDTVWVAGSAAYSNKINSISSATNEITFDLAMPLAGTGTPLEKHFVRDVYMVQAGKRYDMKMGRDYFALNFADQSTGFRLNSSAELNVGATVFDPSNDYIFCDIVGYDKDFLRDGPMPFGENKSGQDYISNGVVLLYQFMSEHCGISLNTQSFIDAYALVKDDLAICLPDNAGDGLPNRLEVIKKICQSLLLKAYFNEGGVFSIKRIAPVAGSGLIMLDSNDIQANSFNYALEYGDLSSTTVRSDLRELFLGSPDTAVSGSTTRTEFVRSDGWHQLNAINQASSTYMYLHQGNKILEVNTYHDTQSQFDLYVNRLKSIVGDRSGKMKIRTKNVLFGTNLNDAIGVSRERLLGFSYVSGSSNARTFNVTEIEKNFGDVSVTLDDQKGIQDNSGGF